MTDFKVKAKVTVEINLELNMPYGDDWKFYDALNKTKDSAIKIAKDKLRQTPDISVGNITGVSMVVSEPK